MKKLLLPAALVFIAGCGQQGAGTDSSNATSAATPTTIAPADNAATNAATPEAVNVPADECVAPTSVPKQKPGKYRVVDEVQPDMPPEVVKALRAAKMAPPPASFMVPVNAKVQLQTSKGSVTLQLDTKGAPLHSKSFYYLSKKGFFDGTTFHRWANLMEGSGKPGYILQGGDPLSKNAATRSFAGRGGPGYQIPREHNASVHNALVLAAARTADPDSAGSQFYITQNPVCFLDQGDGYTVFGRVVSGKDVALKLTQDDVIKKAIAQ